MRPLGLEASSTRIYTPYVRWTDFLRPSGAVQALVNAQKIAPYDVHAVASYEADAIYVIYAARMFVESLRSK
jgi:hypothetical protein